MSWRITNAALAMLFWGWWADFMGVAIAFVIIIAMAPRLDFRLQLDEQNFNRIVDLTSVVVTVVGLTLIINSGRQGIFTLFAWAPILLFPLFASQQYSTRGTISLSSLLLLTRRLQKQSNEQSIRRIDIAWSYMALCVLAASVQVIDHPWFFLTLFILVAVALFSSRPSRYHPVIWMIVILTGGGMGYAGQVGLRTLHDYIEEVSLSLLESWFSHDPDLSHTRTAIGHIGKLKLSNRIIWQVRAGGSANVPTLLRQASYQTYKYGSWLSEKVELTPLKHETGMQGWRTEYQLEPKGKYIELSGDIGGGVLPVPMGVYRISGLLATAVNLSEQGAFVADDGPEFAHFKLYYTGQDMDAGPDEKDIEIPASLLPTMQQLAQQLQLDPDRPEESLVKIQRFFQDDFAYSLFLRGAENDHVPLRTFLLKERKGHCEYFATAGVMLLRMAGIPSRYAGGYAVNEYSAISDSWLVRKRHAHAWSLAYINGAWRNLDYTPSVWAEMEGETTPWWTGIADLWTIIRHGMQTKDDASEDGAIPVYVWILAIAVLIMIARWLYKQKRARLERQFSHKIQSWNYQGMDSPFFEIQTQLDAAGYGPLENETFRQWVNRLAAIQGTDFSIAELKQALAMHYRYRFSSDVDQVSKQELHAQVKYWLQQQRLLLNDR